MLARSSPRHYRWAQRNEGNFLLHFLEGRLFVLLVYAIATVFQLYLGRDMMYEMRRRKPERTFLLTQGIFNLPHHIAMVGEELAFDDAVSYT